MTVMGLLEAKTTVTGSIRLDGTELTTMTERQRDGYRWRRIAIAFQNSLDVLNPVMTVGAQIAEAITRHMALDRESADERARQLFNMVGLEAK